MLNKSKIKVLVLSVSLLSVVGGLLVITKDDDKTLSHSGKDTVIIENNKVQKIQAENPTEIEKASEVTNSEKSEYQENLNSASKAMIASNEIEEIELTKDDIDVLTDPFVKRIGLITQKITDVKEVLFSGVDEKGVAISEKELESLHAKFYSAITDFYILSQSLPLEVEDVKRYYKKDSPETITKKVFIKASAKTAIEAIEVHRLLQSPYRKNIIAINEKIITNKDISEDDMKRAMEIQEQFPNLSNQEKIWKTFYEPYLPKEQKMVQLTSVEKEKLYNYLMDYEYANNIFKVVNDMFQTHFANNNK